MTLVNPNSGGGALPPSLDGANFANFTPGQLKEAAQGMKAAGSTLTQDQLLNDLHILQQAGVTFDKAMQFIKADEPALAHPNIISFADLTKATQGNAVKTIAKNINSGAASLAGAAGVANPWFNASPMVAFAVAFQEFMKSVSKMKLLEGEVLGPIAIKMQMEMAKAIGEKIMEAANKDAQMAINAAIQAGVTAVISAVSAIATASTIVKSAGKTVTDANGVATKVGAWSDGKLNAWTTVISSTTKAAESVVTMAVKIEESKLIIEKANAERQKVLLEALLTLANKRSSDSSENLQSLKELFNQIVQAWTQMVTSNIDAHKLGRH